MFPASQWDPIPLLREFPHPLQDRGALRERATRPADGQSVLAWGLRRRHGACTRRQPRVVTVYVILYPAWRHTRRGATRPRADTTRVRRARGAGMYCSAVTVCIACVRRSLACWSSRARAHLSACVGLRGGVLPRLPAPPDPYFSEDPRAQTPHRCAPAVASLTTYQRRE